MRNKQFSFIDNSSVEYDLPDRIHPSKTSCINMAMKIRDSVRQKPSPRPPPNDNINFPPIGKPKVR